METFLPTTSLIEDENSKISTPTAEEVVLRIFPAAQASGKDIWRVGIPSNPSAAIAEINASLPEDQEVALVGQGGGVMDIVINPRTIVKPTITKPLVLGIATLMSVIVTMAWAGPQLLWEWDWGYALPGALGIVAILFAHEMGHFLAMKRLGINVSYPYLIPFPLWWGGTFGGFVSSETPPNRHASLYLAAGGPLLGLLVTIPIAVVGLWLSERGPLDYDTIIFEDGGLFWNMMVAMINPSMEGNGYLRLHPLAAAGYFGVFLTGLNLLPVFPLDGGRWIFALLPPFLRRPFSVVAIIALIIFTFVSKSGNGFLIGFCLGALRYVGRGIATDDVTPLSLPQRILAFFLWIGLFILLWDINPVDRIPFPSRF
jgi:Zn-dependent protease